MTIKTFTASEHQTAYLRKQIEQLRLTADELEKIVNVIEGLAPSSIDIDNKTVNTSDIKIKALELAKKELGVKEATGRNDGARIAYYQEGLSHLIAKPGIIGKPWCASFVSRMLLDACTKLGKERILPHLAGAGQFYTYAKKYNWQISKTPKEGSLFLVNLNKNTAYADHIGFVLSVNNNNFKTIEGNEGNKVTSETRTYNDKYTFITITG